MKTNVLTNLTATAIPADVRENPDILRQIYSGIVEGQSRTLNLGPEGLFFKRANNITVFIPTDQLWRLESAFASPAPGGRAPG